MSVARAFPGFHRAAGARADGVRAHPPVGSGRPSVVAPALALAALLSLPAAGLVQAQTQNQPRGSVEERLGRVERMLDSGTLVQLLESVRSLQNEVRSLRGEIELQGHRLNQLESRQRELYLDVDRRLQRMEAARAAPPPSAGAATSSPPGTAASAGAAGAAGAGAAAGTATAADTGTGAGAATPSTVASAGSQTQASSPAASAGDGGIEEQQAYQAAFNLLKAGRYEQATKAFRSFLDQYPDGKYADNAQYWLGETYYVTRKFDEAMAEFRKLLVQHPQSQKLTHAMLKIGYIHDEKGQKDEARQVLNQLIEKYPESTAAGLAQKRLERIGAQ